MTRFEYYSIRVLLDINNSTRYIIFLDIVSSITRPTRALDHILTREKISTRPQYHRECCARGHPSYDISYSGPPRGYYISWYYILGYMRLFLVLWYYILCLYYILLYIVYILLYFIHYILYLVLIYHCLLEIQDVVPAVECYTIYSG